MGDTVGWAYDRGDASRRLLRADPRPPRDVPWAGPIGHRLGLRVVGASRTDTYQRPLGPGGASRVLRKETIWAEDTTHLGDVSANMTCRVESPTRALASCRQDVV